MEKNKVRLLVVEDEKKLCDMIAKSLHQSGYEVDVCNDGEEALDMIYAEMYDLIVLDLNLPVLVVVYANCDMYSPVYMGS